MESPVLEKAGRLLKREIAVDEKLGDGDVRIRIRSVGIGGSDLHYHRHGAIGPFVVKEPMAGL